MSDIPVIRPAAEDDVPGIHRLLSEYARRGIVLDRSEADLLHYLKNFTVAVEASGMVVGCMAVRDFGNDLLEVRSLAVDADRQGAGIGRQLVESAKARLDRSREGYRLFALTLTPEFFLRLGFTVVKKDLFPEKIWHDCSQCPKQDHCDEVAVIFRGGTVTE